MYIYFDAADLANYQQQKVKVKDKFLEVGEQLLRNFSRALQKDIQDRRKAAAVNKQIKQALSVEKTWLDATIANAFVTAAEAYDTTFCIYTRRRTLTMCCKQVFTTLVQATAWTASCSAEQRSRADSLRRLASLSQNRCV